MLAGGKILVTAELITHHTFIELELPASGDKLPAEVVAIDYDANLALLRPSDPAWLEPLGRFELDNDAAVGDSVEILQIENNGDIARTPATLTTISVVPYPMETISLLSYKLSSPLQNRDSSFVLPVVRQGRLLGLLMRYDSRSQSGDVLPAPVIARFLERASESPYHGFPKAGLAFASTRDPQFRSFIGLNGGNSGVYITEVLPDSPASVAGMRRGDVLLSVDGHSLDQDGLYEDSRLGKVLFTHLVTSRPSSSTPIPLEILRDGKKLILELIPAPSDHTKMVSPPYLYDQPPRYVVLGGIVFQELSRSYLREWGGNWRKSAPQRLVYLDATQNELPADHGKVVFVSAVLPSPETMGYGNLNFLVVKSINGKPIHRLEDVVEAADQPMDGFQKIEFEEDPGVIYLDASGIEKNREQLMKHYGLPTTQRL
ncbi:MAG: trypsin-like peptidase domain-containing protein [Terrimicrobiaceae bacterium]